MTIEQSEKNAYDFRYQCDENEIDLRTLLYSQEYYFALMNELNRSLFPNQSLSIRVKAIEPGSFVVSQIVEISVTVGTVLFSVGPISDLFNALGALFHIRDIISKHPDEKPKEIPIQEINVVNNGIFAKNLTISYQNGDKFEVNNQIFCIYKTNQKVDDYAAGVSDVITNDDRVTGINIINSEDKKIVWNIDRKQLMSSNIKNPYLVREEIETIVEDEFDCVVTIIKPDLSDASKNKWEILKDNKLIKNVELLDTSFKARIRSKDVRFGFEDEMLVKIRTTSVWNEKKNQYEEKRQEILEVLEFPVSKARQMTMFDKH